MDDLFGQAKEKIKEARKILVVSHTDVDGDALGSMLAMKLSLEAFGKETDVFCASSIPQALAFLPGAESVKKEICQPYDLICGLDYGDLKRLETVAEKIDIALPDISFDHHPFINQSGQIKIIDTTFSSTCEIVYWFLSINDLPIDKEIATCLLTGISTDTWSFRHPNVTARTFQAVSKLVLKGVSLNKIAKMANGQNIEARSKIWGKALTKVSLDRHLGFAFCFLSHQELKEFEATTRDLSGLASMLCMIPGARFSLVLSEIEAGYFDGSFRALPGRGIDVSFLAKNFGGGGHRLSAGFKTNILPESVIKKIKELIMPC